MNTVSLPMAASLMIVTGIIGLTGGYYISPTYQQTMYVKEEMGLGQADRFVDLRYIDKMAAHHTGAILLANQIESLSQRKEIKDLAADIKKGEPKLIDELYQWKREWYNDTRKARDPIVANLGSADEKSDLRFLNALIAHHEAGIEMTQEIRKKSSRKEVLDNADAVESFLTNTLVTFKNWRSQWYNIQ